MKRVSLTHFTAACLLTLSSAAHAAYPDRTVTMVVPYPPGGTTDILARLVTNKLGQKFGQTFVVENKPGAAGAIGTAQVARAKGDGYTLLMGTIGTHGINPAMFKEMTYDAIKDFAPVIIAAVTPNVLIANKDAPFNTIQEFLTYAKKNPDKVSFGSTSVSGSPHMSGELLKAKTGLEMVHVPYQGGGPMLNDIIGGQILVGFDNLPSSAGHINAGTLKALAVTTPERWPTFKDVPTFAEAGVTDYEVQAWFGILAPAGTSADIVDKLNSEIAQIIKTDAAIQKQLSTMGARHIDNKPEDFAAHIKGEVEKWNEVVKINKLEKL